VSAALPVEGFWCLARRVVQVRRQAARDRALGITRMTAQPSAQWFATAERLRQEDNKRVFASLAKRARSAAGEV
jgi:hypothetical protein